MKKFSILMILAFNSLAFNSFNPGDIIDKAEINENIAEINAYLDIYGHGNYFSPIISDRIKSEEFNVNIMKLNNQFSLNIPALSKGDSVTSETVNNYFNSLMNGAINNLFFNSCSARKDSISGIYQIDYDGFFGNLPVKEYCNYVDGVANVNNFKIVANSRGFNQGSLSESNVAGTHTGFGRGVGIAVFNENLQRVHASTYDNYGTSSEATRLNNDLANTTRFPVKSLLVLTVGDSAELNVGIFSSRLNSKYGCNISGLAYRTGYICISYKKADGQFVKVYEQKGTPLSRTQYIDYTNFYNFLNP